MKNFLFPNFREFPTLYILFLFLFFNPDTTFMYMEISPRLTPGVPPPISIILPQKDSEKKEKLITVVN